MKWEPKERHPKSPRAYQIVSQIVVQRPSNGVVSPIANNFSTADIACMDEMSHGGQRGWTRGRRAPQQQQAEPSADELERRMCPRPLTATLERPRIINIALLGKIDMTLTRKCALSIANLCIADGAKRNGASLRQGRGGKTRKFAGSAAAAATLTKVCRRRRRSQQQQPAASEDETMSSPQRAARKAQLRAPASKRRPAPGGGDVEPAVPLPCTTCGRPEQPERLHSHPLAKTQTKQKPQAAPPQPPKSSVRKPVPINFRSSAKSPPPAATRSPKRPQSGGQAAAPQQQAAVAAAAPQQARSGRPRTVVCYLCGREFGTTSYPLHEPHCLQKWQRENALLPPHLQRQPPKRPDKPPATEEWNQQAWQAVQATLVPCEYCGRTFNPDRLEVHQRSCKGGATPRKVLGGSELEAVAGAAPGAVRVGQPCRHCGRLFGSASVAIHEAHCLQRPPEQPPPQQQPAPEARRGPRIVLCYLCGRGFTPASLHIHEEHCLRRWRQENDRLPPAQRRPEPERPPVVLTESGELDLDATVDAAWQSHLQQLVPCQSCGRTFNPDRLAVHQRACKGRR